MIRKLKYVVLGAFFASGFFSSCNFLDVEPYIKDMTQFDSLFTRKETTEQWLWSVYSTLNGRGGEIAWAALTVFPYASDEVIFEDSDNLCEKYQNCEYSADSQLNDDRWHHMYIGIRKATIFINNVMNCVELSTTDRLQLQGEARFLRAYFYWMLMKQYGPIPIMPEGGQEISLSYEELAIPRSHFDDCVEYVVSELEQAARRLPSTRPRTDLGRATQGIALAARAKVLLYAASPLYNGNTDLFNFTDDQGNVLISQTEDNSKWARAAAAAKEVIDLGYYGLVTVSKSSTTAPLASNVPTANFPDGAGDIDPFESYRSIFNGELTLNSNQELIFIRQKYSESINWIIWHSFPRVGNGLNHVAVTLKQLNAYYMRDGYDKDLASTEFPYVTTGFTSAGDDPFLSANIHRIFSNREPRFYASVSYNGCIWENLSADAQYQNFKANYYRAGTDGKQLSLPYRYPVTGLGLKKYYHPDDTWQDVRNEKYGEKYEPNIRYADVLLWYAEALNEVKGTHEFTNVLFNETVTIARNVDEMRSAFSQVRFRAGLPDLTAVEYNDPNVFRERLKRERQVELFMEGARYFDLRRWKDDATKEENEPLTGFNVDIKDGSSRERFYQETPLMMSKIFLPKMYFWPISTVELKRNSKLTQAPGW